MSQHIDGGKRSRFCKNNKVFLWGRERKFGLYKVYMKRYRNFRKIIVGYLYGKTNWSPIKSKVK